MVSNNYKILIVSSVSMRDHTQTAITMSNIWGRWPLENIMEVVTTPESGRDKKTIDVPNITVYGVDQPLRNLSQRLFLRRINTGLKFDKEQVVADNKIRVKQLIRQFMYTLVDSSPLYISSIAWEKIFAFQPDAIYTMGGNVTVMKTAYVIAKRLDLVIIPHFMDNWPECIQWEDNRLLKYYRVELNCWLRKIYKRTKLGLTISKGMAIEYEKRTGLRHVAFMNPIDIRQWKCEEVEKTNSIKLLYVGGLNLNRDRSLYCISEMLTKIESDKGIQSELHIYTSKQYTEKSRKLFKNKKIFVHNSVEHNKVKELFEESNILILAESLDDNNILDKFTKYSISTKVAEYLASGRLIFYLGNKNRELTHYLSDHHAAIICDLKIDIYDKLYHAMSDDNNKIIKNAEHLAMLNHNISTVNERLEVIISECLCS